MFTFLSSLGKHPDHKDREDQKQTTDNQTELRMMFIDPEDLSKKIKPFLNKNLNIKCDVPFVAKIKEVETFHIDLTFTSVPSEVSVPGYKIVSGSLKCYCVSSSPFLGDFRTGFDVDEGSIKLTDAEHLKTTVSESNPLQIVGTLDIIKK